ncbi:Uncharacterised protein [Vibrio cholerae]|nr:Uncharacterised protein [Vibrio cholerae]
MEIEYEKHDALQHQDEGNQHFGAFNPRHRERFFKITSQNKQTRNNQNTVC